MRMKHSREWKRKNPEADVSKVHIIHKLAGRVHSKRIMGKASFAHLKDRDGIIQLYASEKDLGDDQYHILKLSIWEIISDWKDIYSSLKPEKHLSM